jgi:hypothetical protein
MEKSPSVDLRQPLKPRASQPHSLARSFEGETAMLRYILAALAVIVLFSASIIPDDAYARGGRGGGGRGGGGFHGGGGRGGGFHAGGGFHGGGGRHGGFAGRPHPSHPIAGRPGRPIAGRPGYGGGYYRPGLGYGVAAVGAAAAAGAYYNGYGYDPYYGYDDGEPYVGAESAGSDPIAECARRFKTYDPATQTYIVRKGVRASCP